MKPKNDMRSREIAEIITGDPEYPLSTDMVQSYIQDFAKQKCAEQRELCADAFLKCEIPLVQGHTKITNAPEPNFG